MGCTGRKPYKQNTIPCSRTRHGIPSPVPKTGVRSESFFLKIKRLLDGRFDKNMARLVVKEYKQKTRTGLRLSFCSSRKEDHHFLHFIYSEDLECDALDYSTAFLNGKLKEYVYIELHQDGTCNLLRLNKALYGMMT
jgi:hypothetical protein